MFGMEVKIPDIKSAIKEHKQDVKVNMNRLGFSIVRNAKKRAPVYRGMLKNRIVHEVKEGIRGLYLRVYVPVKGGNGFYYAAAVEFGTKPHRPPFQPIRRWVWLKRRGMGVSEKEVDNVAWAIVRKIARVGTKKQPFLEPAAYHVLKSWRW